MARKQRRYPPEFRREIVGLVRSGRSPEALAREFEPSASAIRKWVKQADLDEGHRNDGLTTFERQELRQAKREIKRLRGKEKVAGEFSLVCVAHNLKKIMLAALRGEVCPEFGKRAAWA